MATYILRRVLWTALLLTVISFIIFTAVRMIPSDIVDILFQTEAGGSYQQEHLREFFGLDKPFHIQYLNWVKKAFKGDLGSSFRTGKPVLGEIITKLPVTLELIFLGTVIGLIIALPLGILAARKRNTTVDLVIQPLALIGLSIPSFWFGSLLLIFISLYVPFFNPLGYVPFIESPARNLAVMALPALSLGVVMTAAIMRMTRSSVLEVLNQDYIQNARAKGLRERTVIYKHVLRNALIPVVTTVGIQIGVLIGGTIVLEKVFALPGLGRLLVTAINERDYPVVQGTTLIIAFLFILINLLTDLIYRFLDPRIQYD